MGAYIPSGQLTNVEVAAAAGISEEWILQATGITTRYIAGPDEATSDLGARALDQALEASGLDAAQLDLIIVTTSTPDDLGPATACRIQERIQAANAVAFDVNAACSGWLFGINAVRGWFAVNSATRYAAVVTVDTYAKFVNRAEPATASMFSDGAVATIVGPVETGGFDDIQLWSDGAIADTFGVSGGGSRLPLIGQAGQQQLLMDAEAIRVFAFQALPQAIGSVLHSNQLTMDDIDLVVFHQPNPVLVERLAGQHGIPPEKLIITGRDVGHIGSGCAPYALATAAQKGRVTEGSRIIVAAFGAGMTWGAALLTWSGWH